MTSQIPCDTACLADAKLKLEMAIERLESMCDHTAKPPTQDEIGEVLEIVESVRRKLNRLTCV